MLRDDSFLAQRGNYRSLITFQKAECIYDITFHFAHRFLEKGDRTIDQMVQAARSGKQNIVEGASASATSKETEIKLMNVAKASMHELLVDFEDYLRVRQLRQWQKENPNSSRRAAIALHTTAAPTSEINFPIETTRQ